MKEKFPENLLHVKSMQQEVSERCAKRSKQAFLNRYCSLFDHWKIHTFKKYYLLFRQLKQVTVFAQKMSNQIAMGNCQPFGMTETLVRK